MKKTLTLSTILLSAALSLFSGCALGDSLAESFKSTMDESGLGSLIDSGATVVSSIQKLTEDITTEDAYYIGRSVAANLLTNYGVYNNQTVETYLNKICQALVLNSSDPELYNGYHVKILDSKEVNAFSTPGGHILVTRGLIACALSEDALAAVIAHEIAHIQLKHSLSSIKASRFKDTIDAVSDMFADEAMDDVSDDIVSNMVGSGYSQGQEYDADEEALSLMAQAGYQPSAMVSMLEQMKTFESSTNKAGFFKTHPSPKSRIANLKSFLKKYKLEDTTEYREDRYNKAMN